jgi:hypothetical protein
MYEENDGLFQDFEIDTNDLPKYISYVTYRALSCYYANKYDEASKWINNLLNDLSLKRFPQAQLRSKTTACPAILLAERLRTIQPVAQQYSAPDPYFR